MSPRTISAWLLVAATLVLPLSAARADFDKGLAAYERKDNATALAEFRASAELGDAMAQNKLGVMYQYGQGVPQSGGTRTRQRPKQPGSDARQRQGCTAKFPRGR